MAFERFVPTRRPPTFKPKACACGEVFVPTCGRQFRCPECAQSHSAKYRADYSRQYRITRILAACAR